jgi:predicted aspartyl protease
MTFRPHPGLSRRLLPLIALLAGLAGCVAAPNGEQQAACPIEKRAELPLTVLRNFLLVPAALDGGKVLMVVDTGAEATTVTPETVRSLGLAQLGTGNRLLGVGGLVEGAGTVRLRQIQLGGEARGGLDLDVGAMPSFGSTAHPVAGLLGVDVLGGYDIELDLPHQIMTLYTVPPCPQFVPPGFTAADGHDMQPAGGGLLFVSAHVEGRPVRALLDTGARSSLVTRRVAHVLGITDEALERDPLVAGRGIGSASLAFRRHRFDEIRVGEVAVRDMTVNVAALPIAGIDMLLGADWLTGRTVWISRAAGRFYQRTGTPPGG